MTHNLQHGEPVSRWVKITLDLWGFLFDARDQRPIPQCRKSVGHCFLGIRLTCLISSIVGKSIILPRRDNVPRDVIVEKKIRDGGGEVLRYGGCNANLFRRGAASRDIALVEDITPGGGLKGRVSRRGWVDSDWIEAKHVNDCNRYVLGELVHQREVIFGFDRSVR